MMWKHGDTVGMAERLSKVLIAMQRPDATLVAGYEAWQDKFDRQVKKGAKGD